MGERQENLKSPVVQSERKSEATHISEKRLRSKSRERSRSYEDRRDAIENSKKKEHVQNDVLNQKSSKFEEFIQGSQDRM